MLARLATIYCSISLSYSSSSSSSSSFFFFFVFVFVFFAFSDDIKRVKEVREMCSRPFTIVRSWSYRGLLSDPVAEEGKNINL